MEVEIDGALAEFQRCLNAGTPYATDRDLVAELMIEARPVISALRFALESDLDFDVRRPEHGEGLALVTLLGRRAAALGVSPTAAATLAPALASGLAKVGRSLRKEDEHVLTSLCLEGFCAGREERQQTYASERVADSQACVELVPRLVLLALSGELDAESIAAVIDRFGRTLLKRDAVAAVVEMSRLVGPAPDRAAEIFTAADTARMLGVRCVFVGASDEWMAAAERANLDLDLTERVDALELALADLMPLAGRVIRPASWLPAPLKTILGRTE